MDETRLGADLNYDRTHWTPPTTSARSANVIQTAAPNAMLRHQFDRESRGIVGRAMATGWLSPRPEA
jgi:hypothetical protein